MNEKNNGKVYVAYGIGNQVIRLNETNRLSLTYLFRWGR